MKVRPVQPINLAKLTSAPEGQRSDAQAKSDTATY
jgi:hypothetical protein